MKQQTAHTRRGLVNIILITSILILAVSCKKQPTTPPSGSTAKGYLTSDTTSCYPTHTHGIWYSGISAGTDSNFIDVTLNITSPGNVYQTIVYGEFEGTAEDTWNQNHLAPITKGRFKLVN